MPSADCVDYLVDGFAGKQALAKFWEKKPKTEK